MGTHLDFDYKKAVQAVNYFASKSGGNINKLKVIKLIYFADRYHLRKYGRPITNDEYFAMEYGPVGSGVKDIAEMTQFLDPKEKKYASIFINPSINEVKSINSCEIDVFSDSDMEALDFAWDKFGKYDQFDLADITHRYPEWEKHRQALVGDPSRIKMSYKDFLDDPSENSEKCHSLDQEEKEDRLTHLRELQMIESLWS